ncbi:MAG: nitrilase-related carbon-nitrogen hydrolase [Candidatus Kapaibacterium sp.]|jgi:predicted amidohydrolase
MLLKPCKIALAQTTSVLGDVARNVEHHVAVIHRAISAGAEAIVFPELSLTGYTLRDLNFEVALDPRTSEVLQPLRALSKKITIICGGVEEDERGAVFNSAFLFENGEAQFVHHKIYPPTYGLFEEMRYFSKGTTVAAFDSTRLGRIGILVCEDLWHPSLPYLLACDDAQMIITIAASPTRLETGEDAAKSLVPENYIVNREHHAAYARLFGVYLAFVNRVGVEDGVNFWGGSELVTPGGETVALAKFFEEDLVITEIDPELVRTARQFSRHALDEDILLTKQILSEVYERSRKRIMKSE